MTCFARLSELLLCTLFVAHSGCSSSGIAVVNDAASSEAAAHDAQTLTDVGADSSGDSAVTSDAPPDSPGDAATEGDAAQDADGSIDGPDEADASPPACILEESSTLAHVRFAFRASV